MDSLSLILLNYNTYELTCDCIRSIHSSNLEEIELEIIVVDNGSTELYAKPFKELFPDITYVRSEVNLGFARGNNVGLHYATKTYALLLNTDTLIIEKDTLRKTICKVKEFKDQVVLTTRLLSENDQPQTAYQYLPALSIEVFLTFFLYKFLPQRQLNSLLLRFHPDQSRIIHNGYITATYYLFPRKLLSRLPEKKLYDDTFMYGEELFWATEWMRADVKMYYFSEVAIRHFVGGSTRKLDNYTLKTRRRFQIKAEHQYLLWRFSKPVIWFIYSLRIVRFLLLSSFDKDIRMRLLLMFEVIFKLK